MHIQHSDLTQQAQHQRQEKTELQISANQQFAGLFDQFSLAGAGISQLSVPEQDPQDTLAILLQALLRAMGDEQADNRFGKRVQRSQATDFLSKPQTVQVTLTVGRREQVSETLSFSSQGTVHTADGQNLQLDLAVQMQHTRVSEQWASLSQRVTFKDPLVVNFPGTALQLSEQQFDFDIDADGELDKLRFLTSDSGWLALDSNGDGQISDGSELFGALSGNGFDDLKKFDDDNNGFIDEADRVYDSLLIWQKRADQDQLTSLKHSDIGAIYLAAVESPFTLYSEQDKVLGQVRDSSVYIAESGKLGTVQQVDVAV